jgi:hypothetical protein
MAFVHPCCPRFAWEPVADLGHTDGFDFDLGRCRGCGALVMHLWSDHAPESNYQRVEPAEADAWLKADAAVRKRLLREWFNR